MAVRGDKTDKVQRDLMKETGGDRGRIRHLLACRAIEFYC